MKIERVEEVYKALEGLVIALDRDPAARGPQYLQDLISKTRGYLNTTAYYLQEVLRERHACEMDLESREADFQIQSDELLSNDRRVTELPNIDDRRAMINVLLSAPRQEILAVKREIKNLSHVEKAIRLRHKELEGTMSAIRLQRSLIEAELRTGAYYGDEGGVARGWGRGGKAPRPDEIDDVEDLDAIWAEQLQNVSASGATDTPKARKPPKVVPPGTTDLGDDDGDILAGIDMEAQPPPPAQLGTEPNHVRQVLEVVPAPDLSLTGVGVGEDPTVERFLAGDDDFDDILSTL